MTEPQDLLEGDCADCGEHFTRKRPNNMSHTRKRFCSSKCETRNYRNRTKHYMLVWQLKNIYGITYEKYQEMLKEQDGVCKICKRAPRKFRLSVDHCHTTKKVRGLLCPRCNSMLGWMELYGPQALDYLR